MALSVVRDSSAFWHEQYDQGTGVRVGPNNNEVRLNWHSGAVLPGYQPYVDNIINGLSITNTMRVAVIGAGFGEFAFVALRDHADFLPGNWLSCEDSAWVQIAQGESEDIDVRIGVLGAGGNPTAGEGIDALRQLSAGRKRAYTQGGITAENLLSQDSRTTVKNALGGAVDLVLTEWTLMNYLTNDEATAFSNAAHSSPLSADVAHIVTTSLDQHNRDLTAWKALLPNDTFIDWITLQVV